ncbi:hypothetical protein [Roseovarius sp.]|uniref:hypothetical protein n=1 Tax=Roseovarius sp. TaxID=1486281 RepID=UPI003B5BD74C
MILRRGLLAGGVLLILSALAWRVIDRYERGSLYPWVEALIYPANPHDGFYVTDRNRTEADPLADRIAQTIARGSATPTLQIRQHRAFFNERLAYSPVAIGLLSLEVCLRDDGAIELNSTNGWAVRYCHHESADPIVLRPGDGGRLTCRGCTSWGLPTHYLRADPPR